MEPLNYVRLGNGVSIASYVDEKGTEGSNVLVEAAVHVRLKDKSNFYPMLDSALTDPKSEKAVFEQFSELWGEKSCVEVYQATAEAMRERGIKGWDLLCPNCKLPRHTRAKLCSDAFHFARVR